MTWHRFDIDLCPRERALDSRWPRYSRIIWVQGLSREAAEALVRVACLDPAREVFASSPSPFYVEFAPRWGVTCAESAALLEVARWMGLETPELCCVVGTRYVWPEGLPESPEEAQWRPLFNPLLERFSLHAPLQPHRPMRVGSLAPPEEVPLEGLSPTQLRELSRERQLALDEAELLAVAHYFARLKRSPNELELEMIAQTWSEHCVHKTFRAHIQSREVERDGRIQEIDVHDMLETWLKPTCEPHLGEWVCSAFVDNAGIVRVGEGPWTASIKMETHNHPSALDPFGGAHTGVGGVIRDILGVSARPIANVDVLCFGPPELAPPQVIAPAQVARGVLDGVAHYGNTMGIPTVAGAIRFDAAYARNPLVFCGTVGIGHEARYPREVQVGDWIVVAGGRTGRDGLRGATFSSFEMGQDSAELSGGAVQIGAPLVEAQVSEWLLAARDAGLYHAVTDCGAGGFSSAIGELASHVGAKVELSRAPVKDVSLRAWELWLSESQERMVLAVPPESWPELLALGERFGCELSVLGHFGHEDAPSPHLPVEPMLCIEVEGSPVGRLSARFLREGRPPRRLQATWCAPVEAPSPLPTLDEAALEGLVEAFERLPLQISQGEHRTLWQALLHAKLTSPERLLRQHTYRRYDHEVGGGTRIKPLLGWGEALANLSALWPLELRQANAPALLLSSVLAPQLGALDPAVMAWALVDEAIATVVAAGADPRKVALLDNVAWGSVADPQQLGALVRCIRACAEAAQAYGAPFVSGKDSLNNAWRDAEQQLHSVLPTLVITALGQGEAAALTRPVLPSTHAQLWCWGPLGESPLSRPDAQAPARYRALSHALKAGPLVGCRPVGQAGLWLSAAEMTLGAPHPCTLELSPHWHSQLLEGFMPSPGALLLALPGDAAPPESWLPRDLGALVYVGQASPR